MGDHRMHGRRFLFALSLIQSKRHSTLTAIFRMPCERKGKKGI